MNQQQLIILVGPPGSGKSTLAKQYELDGYVRVSQDDQGKDGHRELFKSAIEVRACIVVDRMNFSEGQRRPYTSVAKAANYNVKIIVIHEGRRTCYDRMMKREGHPTIQDSSSANSALNLFFSKYEKPLKEEADEIEFRYPEGNKPEAVICDLDGTLCNLDKRLHHVRTEPGVKKNWKAFFDDLEHDEPNEWCRAILHGLYWNEKRPVLIVYASGRPDDYERKTRTWFEKHGLDFHPYALYMRCRGDHRDDTVAKEIILDFEILTRYTPIVFIDDRQRVIDLWRRRGFTALQCAKGDF